MNVKKGGLMRKLARSAGFTMIELLVVIAVIGILSVALLATLNPLEQIRKGRDTRTRSDSAQLASALERYNASLGKFPWQASEGEDLNDGTADVDFVRLNAATPETLTGCTATATTPCPIDEVLQQLEETNEVKGSFVDRLTANSNRSMYLYYNDESTGSSVRVCFMPESNTFSREAFDRCSNADGFNDTIFEYAYGTAVVDQNSDDAQEACPDQDSVSAYSNNETFDSTDADELICIP